MRYENRALIMLFLFLVLPVCLAQESDSKDTLEDTATIERKAWVPMPAGAGIGRVGEFYKQGNWYSWYDVSTGPNIALSTRRSPSLLWAAACATHL